MLTLCEYGLREGGGLAAFCAVVWRRLNLSGMRTPKKKPQRRASPSLTEIAHHHHDPPEGEQ